MIIDTHAHYDDEAFDTDREALLMSMYDGGIEKIVNVCASVGGFQDTVKLMEKYPFVYGAVGIHPDDADKMTQETLDEIRRLSHMDKMVAIGEIGLDYYWHKEEEEHQIQQKMFRAQLDIAREEKLPFMIHSREAAEDTLNIVREYMQGGMYGGIIHCFSYSREIAAEYLKMGLYLGIGGVVTFKNAKKLKETVQYAPLSQLVLETDCPYMSPEPNRGKRNSSLNLPYVAQAMRSSNSPLYLLPATMPERSNTTRRLSFTVSGTIPITMRCASPSTMAVLPTPGSPVRHGLFFVRLLRI